MKTIEEHTLPAYLDTSLEDRTGEQWDDIPGLDGYYLISNFGRVKRAERDIYDSQGGHYVLPAKIRLPQKNHSPNRFMHDNTIRLQVACRSRTINILLWCTGWCIIALWRLSTWMIIN